MKGTRDQIEQLLRELTAWRSASGFEVCGGTQSNIASTGESNAAMLDLIAKLDALGARYHFCRDSNSYCLTSDGDETGNR